jgi:L-ribulose-5-phosphate 4-epimerase
LTPEDCVVVALEDGAVLAGSLRPSTDTPTHRRLYLLREGIGCVVHTHSRNATAFAQAGVPLPCLGTTHADYFDGDVPVTREMTVSEIEGEYEWNQGTVLHEVRDVGAALLRGHGAFAWGVDWKEAIERATALEVIAEMALKTLLLSPDAEELPEALLRKHFDRKHGDTAYYGQD